MPHHRGHNRSPNIINTEIVGQETRTGVITSVVEEFSETRNDRLVSLSLIHI